MNSPFRIDILNSAGVKVGAGPLTKIQYIDTRETLDKIGGLSFAVPASDPKARDIQSGRLYDVYDETDGYLGRFIHKKHHTSDDLGQAMIQVEAWSILKELSYQIVGFAREYEAAQIEAIIGDLLGDVSGWTLDSLAMLGTANVTYQGQNVYQAIEELAKRWGYHFRLGEGTRELEFGAFGDVNTEVRFTNLPGQNSQIDEVNDVAIVKRISQSENNEEVYNRVIALGAGTGASQLQLKSGQVGDFYTVQTRTRLNGQREYYIEDAASIAQFGVREIVLLFDQIRPISNTATAKNQAKTELLKNAERWLQRYTQVRQQLDNVQVHALKSRVKVGDKVNIRYKGRDESGELYLDIDADYWVTAHDRSRNQGGDYVSNFQLVSVDRAEKTDTDIMAEAIRGIKSEKLWIKPTAFRYSDTYTDFIANSDGNYQDKDAVFNFTVDETVMEITRVILEWSTRPIFATSVWNQSGLTQTLNAAPTNPHSHALDLSTLATTGLYTVLESTVHPTDIDLYLDDVNISNSADVDYIEGGAGRWRDGGTPFNTPLFVRMDITDLIVNNAGGIYRTFELRFAAAVARTRNVGIPFYTTILPQNNSVGNQGLIECRIITQGVCQALYKD